MRAVDTNVLVRLATGDDVAQAGAAEKFVRGGAWVSHLVIAETVWVLRSTYGLKASQIVTAIEMLLDHPSLAIQEPEVVTAAVAHFRARPAVNFTDCLILEIARKAGHVPVGTFDREFSKLPDMQRISD